MLIIVSNVAVDVFVKVNVNVLLGGVSTVFEFVRSDTVEYFRR